MFRIRLKELREERKISQQKLANIIGVSQSTVGMWENGTNKPEFNTLTKIAEYFDVSVDYIIGTSNNKKTPADKISERDKELIKLLSDLNPDEVQRVLDFVEGLKASHKATPSAHQ